MLVKVTFYGYPDNDDGAGHFGTNVIAHKLDGRHTNGDEPIAGGQGTYDDPITAATKVATDRSVRLLPPRILLYMPYLKKYLLVEDDCASCKTDEWIDVWMNSDAGSDRDTVLACEASWTGDDTQLREVQVIGLWGPMTILGPFGPDPDLEVDTTPLFDTDTGTCNPPG